jgi:hypothetical protein
MNQNSLRVESFQGANVPVRTDGHGNDRVSLWSRRSTKDVMFCDMHAGRTVLPREGDDWVPISTTLPLQIAPRRGLEDGIVVTLEQLMSIFHKDARVLC